MKNTLIYQDQDSLNSVRMIISEAEKMALIAIRGADLKDEKKEESQAVSIFSGVASGLVALAGLVSVAVSATSTSGVSPISGPGISAGLSAIGKLIGGVIGNKMASGVTLIVVAPVAVALIVGLSVRQFMNSRRYEAFRLEKSVLQDRAVQCRDALKEQLDSAQPHVQEVMRSQIALLDNVISNLQIDTGKNI